MCGVILHFDQLVRHGNVGLTLKLEKKRGGLTSNLVH